MSPLQKYKGFYERVGPDTVVFYLARGKEEQAIESSKSEL